MSLSESALALLFLVIAIAYASVGHAGASGYIAAMSLFGLAPSTIRPVALALNVLVASIGVWRFHRAGLIAWRRLLPFVLGSMPAAFLAAKYLHSPALIRFVLAAALLVASIQLWRSTQGPLRDDADLRTPKAALALAAGAAIGVVSGLTGTGGAIFLTPLLLFAHWARTREASGLSAGFVLANSLAGLAGLNAAAVTFPTAMPGWLVAVALGALLGARLGTSRLPVPMLKRVLAVVLAIAAGKLAFT
ncbi:MAG TPA: sulfite exporter TauE/SafE family protein [Patescibacteria group bacterium]|nr:sulfite exporter TauE/SafE family protein [Patescibacteria group bacterium]